MAVQNARKKRPRKKSKSEIEAGYERALAQQQAKDAKKHEVAKRRAMFQVVSSLEEEESEGGDDSKPSTGSEGARRGAMLGSVSSLSDETSGTGSEGNTQAQKNLKGGATFKTPSAQNKIAGAAGAARSGFSAANLRKGTKNQQASADQSNEGETDDGASQEQRDENEQKQEEKTDGDEGNNEGGDSEEDDDEDDEQQEDDDNEEEEDEEDDEDGEQQEDDKSPISKNAGADNNKEGTDADKESGEDEKKEQGEGKEGEQGGEQGKKQEFDKEKQKDKKEDDEKKTENPLDEDFPGIDAMAANATAELLKQSWNNLIPSFGLTYIYLFIHYIFGRLGPLEKYFARPGAEYVSPQSVAKHQSGKSIKAKTLQLGSWSAFLVTSVIIFVLIWAIYAVVMYAFQVMNECVAYDISTLAYKIVTSKTCRALFGL